MKRAGRTLLLLALVAGTAASRAAEPSTAGAGFERAFPRLSFERPVGGLDRLAARR